jgi:hypothetical protein
MNKSKKLFLAAAVLLIVPLTLACSMSRVMNEMMGASTPDVIVVVPTESPTQAPPPVEIPTNTPEIPTDTPEPTQNPGVCTHVDHFDFCVPQQLASALVASTKPEINDQMGAPWEVAPEHTEISLSGYPLSGTQLTSMIYVYPIERYTEMQPDTFPGVISDLKQFIDTGNADVMPYVPFVNAGALIKARVNVYQNDQIQGGSIVTQFAQSWYPINNQMMFYTFQGMTKDGKYYINITMPITQQSMQANGDDIPGGDFEAFGNNYEQYLDTIRPVLNDAAPESFTPNIDLMQKIVEGITYTP